MHSIVFLFFPKIGFLLNVLFITNCFSPNNALWPFSMPLTAHLQRDFQCWDGLSSLILILNLLGNFSLSLFFYQRKNDTRLNIYSFFSFFGLCIMKPPHVPGTVLSASVHFLIYCSSHAVNPIITILPWGTLPGGYVTCLCSPSLWHPPLSLEVTHMAGAEPAWQPWLVRAQA